MGRQYRGASNWTEFLRLSSPGLIPSANPGPAHSILSGETTPWDQDSGETGELDEELKDLLIAEDFEFDSELGQLTKEIADAIGNLLRLSISLRNPAPHDRFMSTEYAKARYFEASDKSHVEAKFPKANQTLIVRLGQALSQKRQYFRYRESHHEKLSHGLFDSGRSDAGVQSTVASSIPSAMRALEAVPVFGELDDDERSDADFSQTSFATTAPDSERLRIPPLPRQSQDGPFECPFCFMLISVSSTLQWKKHVLGDLRPYICLVQDCPTASREYSRRHEWMSHMFQKHWKSWVCPYQCGLDPTTETNLRQHITKIHGPATDMEIDVMVARCSQSRSISQSSPVECPLCRDTLKSVQQYQRHVGLHQIDLALFTLPKIEDENEEPNERNEDEETVSTHSGSYSEALSDDMPPTALPKTTGPRSQNALMDQNMAVPENFLGQQGLPLRQAEQLQYRSHYGSPTPLNMLTGSDNTFNGPTFTTNTFKNSHFNTAHYNNMNFQPEMYQPETDRPEISQPEGGEHPDSREESALTSLTEFQALTKAHEDTLPKEEVKKSGTYVMRSGHPPATSYTDPAQADENYSTLSDLAERRRVQNRIAQKNYRRKLRKRLEDLEDRAEPAAKKYKPPESDEAGEPNREYSQRLREELFGSGPDEKEADATSESRGGIKKMMKGNEEAYWSPLEANSRPTYTRMSRRHLSLETLHVYDIDYTIDADPEYVLIKRWVPEPEQDILWRHTRVIRDQRGGNAGDGGNKRLNPPPGVKTDEFGQVDKKQRTRSNSPNILTYLAGGRPA
ncbi:hypothetical protein EKO27_g3447 [Xylaria grammica]|uniref:BZIP domain-containing protein n=1 Tax=Xylaria grammica TaxID=363999 RepID=A0A439DB67_9PEZI|nr:hypothetical protein EKO27_g3447 [Xylaria grammica]